MNNKQRKDRLGWGLSMLLLLLFAATKTDAQALEPFNGDLSVTDEAYTFCWVPNPLSWPGPFTPSKKKYLLVFEHGTEILQVDEPGVFSYARPEGLDLLRIEVDGYQISPDGTAVYAEPGTGNYYRLEEGFEEGEEQNAIIPIVIVINWPRKKTKT